MKPECYFCNSPSTWECSTCREAFCSTHNHETSRGSNVECVACEGRRTARRGLAAGVALLLALSAPSWATETPAKPRVRPEVSISVKVYPGRPERVSRTQETACVAWVPNVSQLEGGFIACQCALGIGKECGSRKVLKVGEVLQ